MSLNNNAIIMAAGISSRFAPLSSEVKTFGIYLCGNSVF